MQGLGQAHQAAGSVGQPGLVVEYETKALGDAQGGDGQIVFAQSHSQGRDPDEQRHNPANERRAEQSENEGKVKAENLMHILRINARGHRCGNHRRRIGSDTEKPGNAEINEPRISRLNVQAQRKDSVNTCHNCQ